MINEKWLIFMKNSARDITYNQWRHVIFAFGLDHDHIPFEFYFDVLSSLFFFDLEWIRDRGVEKDGRNA